LTFLLAAAKKLRAVWTTIKSKTRALSKYLILPACNMVSESSDGKLANQLFLAERPRRRASPFVADFPETICECRDATIVTQIKQ
jgi:hypothetical protein